MQTSTPGISGSKPHAEFCGIILAGLPASDPRITDRLLVSQLIIMAEATNRLFKENRSPNFTSMRDTYGVILAKEGTGAFAIGEWMAEARSRAAAGSELVDAFVKKLDGFRTPKMTSITDEGLLESFC